MKRRKYFTNLHLLFFKQSSSQSETVRYLSHKVILYNLGNLKMILFPSDYLAFNIVKTSFL